MHAEATLTMAPSIVRARAVRMMGSIAINDMAYLVNECRHEGQSLVWKEQTTLPTWPTLF